MRVPALVTDYCLSICSADFNDWVWKNASTLSPYSYVWSGEYEIFEFNLGHTFNYAEMAALIARAPSWWNEAILMEWLQTKEWPSSLPKSGIFTKPDSNLKIDVRLNGLMAPIPFMAKALLSFSINTWNGLHLNRASYLLVMRPLRVPLGSFAHH